MHNKFIPFSWTICASSKTKGMNFTMPFPYYIDDINKRASEDPLAFARECEAIYNRKVMETAAGIAERSEFSSVVFLSGPSGSGKTTTALKICDALRFVGINAITVSLDNYYVKLRNETNKVARFFPKLLAKPFIYYYRKHKIIKE